MSIERIEFGVMPMSGTAYPRKCRAGKYCYYEDHIKVVDSYLAEIAAAKAEIDKLVLSLESWDEEFK